MQTAIHCLADLPFHDFERVQAFKIKSSAIESYNYLVVVLSFLQNHFVVT